MSIGLSYTLEPQLQQTIAMTLNPRMLQQLKILNLSYTELLDKIDQEAESNVILEVEKKDTLLQYIKSFEPRKIKREKEAKEGLPFEDFADTSKSLYEHLINQLHLEDISKEEFKIGEYLIEHLDGRGFLQDFEQAKEATKEEFKVSDKKIIEILGIIQRLEPEGVGARDLKECLLIQVREHNFSNPELQKIIGKAIKSHLEDLGKKNFKKIARALKIPLEGVESIANFIKNNLTPNPAHAFAPEKNPIIPSFIIEEKEGGYQGISLEIKYGPTLRLSKRYLEMLEDPKTDQATIKFLKGKFEAAKFLLGNILRRQETMRKIIDIVIKSQANFLKNGPRMLTPLLQRDVAQEIGVHPSTISRAIAGKFAQTPRGLFPIKYLCPRDYKGYATQKVLAVVTDLITKEDKKHPLSDEEIKGLLTKEGLKIARRTIAAYREELNIPPTSQRRQRA